jgi:hypothetical protein
MIIKGGDAIKNGSYGCSKLASDVMTFMVLSIQQLVYRIIKLWYETKEVPSPKSI